MSVSRFLKKPLGEKFNYMEGVFAKPWLNFWKTLYINFRLFKFGDAIKFPIIVYGKLEIHRLGLIKIECPQLYRGIISFGKCIKKSQSATRIFNNGEIIFRGPCEIWGGVLMEVGEHSVLDIGEHVLLGENVRFMLRKGCIIGKYARVGFDTQFMDSDFHYMLNIVTGDIRNCTSMIVIGDYNWIGNKTTVKKGTITSDYTIVAAPNSMLNKDYTKITSPCPIIGGSPAKEITSGWRRIYNVSSEAMLAKYFYSHDDIYKYDMSDCDGFCTNNPIP